MAPFIKTVVESIKGLHKSKQLSSILLIHTFAWYLKHNLLINKEKGNCTGPNFSRQPQWTESFAVGNSFLVNRAKDLMGYKAIGRIVFENDGSFLLRETQSSYESILSIADKGPSEDNTHG